MSNSPIVSFHPILKVKKLVPEATLPAKAKDGDAGYDVVAIDDGTWNDDGTYIQYRTGIAIEVPEGYHTELFPRSSITKTDLVLGNSVGLVDNGYRGEILFRFKLTGRFNTKNGMQWANFPTEVLGQSLIMYKKGDKIGQVVIRKTEATFIIQEAEELSSTERGTGGFGSTDKK